MGFKGWNFNVDDFVFNPAFLAGPSSTSSSRRFDGSGKARLSNIVTRLAKQLQTVKMTIGRLKVVVGVRMLNNVEIWRLMNALDKEKEDIMQLQIKLREFVLDPIYPARWSSPPNPPAESSDGGKAGLVVLLVELLVELVGLARDLEKQMDSVMTIIGLSGGAGEVEKLKSVLKSEYQTCMLFQDLYSLGARRIGVFSAVAIGCTPMEISSTELLRECLKLQNKSTELFNSLLSNELDYINSNFTEAKLVFLDIYHHSLDLNQCPQNSGSHLLGDGLILISFSAFSSHSFVC
ncbi:hypothetical protein C1H46_015266 [Malus baccata]|uniref:Uncharacterized protein n=1 Tax=Malus baccata TaxID=106549 RepID=A0A540MK31_MALBA|nr:hypothetical protein C1H46_015266 [Malus baccata]